MGAIFFLLAIGGVVTAVVGLVNGDWTVVVVGVILAIVFFALGRAQIRQAEGLGWMHRGLQSVGNGDVQAGVGQIGNAVAILRSRNQLADLGVAELMLACALAVDGRRSESAENLIAARDLLEDPRTGAYARRPGSRARFEHMAQTLQGHLTTGVPDRQSLHAILFG